MIKKIKKGSNYDPFEYTTDLTIVYGSWMTAFNHI